MVRFTLDHPSLRAAFQASPSTRVAWEASNLTENGELLLLFWAESEDFEAFEEGMTGDPTVTASRCLTELGDRRLYLVEQTGEGRARQVNTELTAAGAIIHECVGTIEGWTLEVEFPDQDALQHFHGFCETCALDFHLVRKYEQSGEVSAEGRFGLTEKQRQALALAAGMGYFEVPRETSLDAIAEEMGISHQAASERIRRAIDVLVHHTVTPEDAPVPEMD